MLGASPFRLAPAFVMAVPPDTAYIPDAGSAGSTRQVPGLHPRIRVRAASGCSGSSPGDGGLSSRGESCPGTSARPRDGRSRRVISAISCGTATLMPRR